MHACAPSCEFSLVALNIAFPEVELRRPHSTTYHLVPRTSHVAPRTSHLAPAAMDYSPFDALGLNFGEHSESVIRKAYRVASRHCHPDKRKFSPVSESWWPNIPPRLGRGASDSSAPGGGHGVPATAAFVPVLVPPLYVRYAPAIGALGFLGVVSKILTRYVGRPWLCPQQRGAIQPNRPLKKVRSRRRFLLLRRLSWGQTSERSGVPDRASRCPLKGVAAEPGKFVPTLLFRSNHLLT
ncbi:hypothetical protein B0J18DRAFT_117729 [Chaetomium sp. MPI-SDFR-AT-0129]|nr:hypothetical protein B0J18DRAFT_117729 [Chaetomium sp. MPI-SDFR-AT-0129]